MSIVFLTLTDTYGNKCAVNAQEIESFHRDDLAELTYINLRSNNQVVVKDTIDAIFRVLRERVVF